MSLGLKNGSIELVYHDPEWDKLAKKLIEKLWNVFEVNAIDIQHIGSTAIKNIMAKPIVDIAVGVTNFKVIDALITKLEKIDIIKSSGQPFHDIVLFSIEDNGVRTYNIQIVIVNDLQWTNHIIFRDYLNTFPEKASEYEKIKSDSAQKCDNDLSIYNNGKNEFIKKSMDEGYSYYNIKKIVQI